MIGELSTRPDGMEITRRYSRITPQSDFTLMPGDDSLGTPVDLVEKGREVASPPKRPQFASSPESPAPRQWKLAWSDEFNDPSGTAPDPARWTYDIGGDGFGNHELEYYTARPENVTIKEGSLEITARKEAYTGPDGVTRDFTSARLKSYGLFSQQYGRFEARIKMPEGHGMWPAFWMLGQNIGQTGWPECGEIDIMENVGFEPSSVHGTIHGPGYSGAQGIGAAFKLPEGKKFSDDYHIFGMEWGPDSIRFSVDDEVYNTVTRKSLPNGAPWVYDHPFFLLLNLAVGGDWPGPPDATTRFPQTMKIDWIRAYAPAEGEATRDAVRK
jgi:beta-glucanase (GH16 family)